MTDKEIIIDGVNVGQCKYLNTFTDCDGYHYYCDLADDIKNEYCEHYKNCYFKQLQKEKFENLNNRQMVESAEDLIYENSELIKNLEEKKQECEELKKQLMQKSEVDMFFNTPIEGWSNAPCGICPHKAENEELKKEIINKNEKIKELRFSVSDLTNRLCYLNAEKSFRIVDLEQTLDTVSEYIKDNCNSCQGIKYGGCDKCELKRIEDIINKAKGR